MTASLESRLARSTMAFGTPVLIVFSLIVYLLARAELYEEFDAGLSARARTLASLVEKEPNAWEFEYAPGIIPEYVANERPAYFQIITSEEEVARSGSLGSASLPDQTGPMESPHFEDVVLPDGRRGRMTGIRFIARLDEDITEALAASHRTEVHLMVAIETRPLDSALGELAITMLLLGCLSVAALAGASVLAVRRGLRPLLDVASRIEQIDASDLSVRMDPASVPRELAPPVQRLDELLARLEESFARERRFTSDVSHELRTPLGGLKAILELASSKERSSAEYRAAIAEAGHIVEEMTTTVERLLWLARAEANSLELMEEPVALAQIVDQCWRAHARDAERNELAFENRISDETIVETDRKTLELVLSNLLSNAAAYTERGGWVRVEGTDHIIDVIDSGPPIADTNLPLVFDRFWRADPSRGGLRAGIGLSLAKSLSEQLGFRLSVENLEDGAVRFRCRRFPS